MSILFQKYPHQNLYDECIGDDLAPRTAAEPLMSVLDGRSLGACRT